MVLLADGEKTAMLNRARGTAEAKTMMATAEGEAIKLLRGAISNSNTRATDYLVALQYLNALGSLCGARNSHLTLFPNTVADAVYAAQPSA